MKALATMTRVISLTTLMVTLSACIYGTANKTPYNARPGDGEVISSGVSTGQPLAGNLEARMDAKDQTRLSKALDGALGKPTTWQNPINGISYTVTPIRKAQIPGNNICRDYTVKASHAGNMQEVRGTACVGQDGRWQVVG